VIPAAELFSPAWVYFSWAQRSVLRDRGHIIPCFEENSMTRGFRKVLTTAAATALLLVSTAVWAQQQGQGRFQGRGGPGGGFGGGGDNLFALLGLEKVQKELEIVDEQKADLKKLGEDAQAKVREVFTGFNFREASEEDRTKLREKTEALTKDARKKVEAILIPDQMKRLKEISLQVRGTSALRDPEIVAALGITEDQTAAIDKVREDMGPKYREAFGGNREENEKKMAELRKESSEKTLAVLKASQREKFEKMKGEKFDIDPSELRGPGGAGIGAPAGGGGNQPRRRPGGNNNN
jgi:Spy/CpxP family protein refolding chaperone